MVNNKNIDIVVKILKEEIKKYKEPIVGVLAKATKDPYKVLVSTMISLRTKDDVTTGASKRLFMLAESPAEMIKLTNRAIEKAIYPAGFYRVKAAAIKKTAGMLLEKFDGKVPGSLDELLTLSGVGRKTANLVLTLGFNKYGICVDTHVHRITNRWGYVTTKNPEDTEFALRKLLPKKHWKIINDLLVTYGQNLCHPVSPKCSRCLIASYCGKIGVNKSR